MSSSQEMKPLGSVEVFTPGSSIAVSIICADLPIAGAVTDWMDGGWLDIPLGSSKKLPEPVKLIFPFKTESLVKYTSSRQLSRGLEHAKGSEFFVLGMFLLAAFKRHISNVRMNLILVATLS